jgi:CYTH domain-containing protein
VRRDEYEVRIPRATFEKLWPLTEGARVEKTRYTVRDGDDRWEIDAFAGRLAGLYLAEIELTSEARAVRLPAFLAVAREVTGDPEYKNRSLATRGQPNGPR